MQGGNQGTVTARNVIAGSYRSGTAGSGSLGDADLAARQRGCMCQMRLHARVAGGWAGWGPRRAEVAGGLLTRGETGDMGESRLAICREEPAAPTPCHMIN